MSDQGRPNEAATPVDTHGRLVACLQTLKPSVATLVMLAVALTALVAGGAIGGILALGLFVVVSLAAVLGGMRLGGASAAATAHSRAGAVSELFVEARALAAVMPDPCVLLAADGLVVYQNERARDALGVMAEGRPLSSFLRTPEMSAAIDQVIATGQPVHVDYVERIPVDRRFDAYITPWSFSHDGASTSGLLLVLHDLTSQERIERMRADFVANASHELRTPLASLSGFIETLQGPARNDADARERFLEIMQKQARRMSRLIDDLLSLSRVEANSHLRPDTPVDLVEIVRYVADTLRPIASEAEVELAVELPDEAVPMRGDRDQLVQVIQNLCENGIKYGASGKRVELKLATRQFEGARPMATISVRDHGPGIAREHLPRLTERFYRVDVASSREKGGTGLGLAIVKHIVNRHRGTLAIESKPGEGACFSVTLEAMPPSTDPAHSPTVT